ncbi:hypothetical protein EMIHUDRAFT_97839 [Emiliania huxleyi CCMP1516]|uniref:Uncharacterized protein n=2 Tax=Emiliania huxleyi TaxID=2903 RepID=A0A0D3KV82_EMIH1|nr:hypothetical protein EMIHUDRAFT_97839 [Emiliania huxleyi CCMP1516]EOD39667.1 hypothetical protein EMIHUDRAFT_97839 [Emiliania huxleyi CCMP1516]|eukprot:XP_005792096.1 hypothetical protein EMIHUDRAFT_97839 [Emiliania huxleyi CCMP1516]
MAIEAAFPTTCSSLERCKLTASPIALAPTSTASCTISLAAANLAAANPTYVWWAALTAVTACHALLSVRFARRSAGAVPSWALGYVVVFSVAAFVRSAFVVRWSSRPHACLFDTPCVTRHSRSAQHTSAKPTRLALACVDRVLGSDLFDRLVANCAEVSFGALIAEVSGFHLDILGLRWLPAVARLCAWPIVLAQACCWTGEISDNKLWHVAAAASRSYLLAIAFLSAAYVYFMIAVDIPMYYAQWRADEARGVEYDSAAKGLGRMCRCQHVADDWQGWSEDATWEALYFGVGPLLASWAARTLTHPARTALAARSPRESRPPRSA